LQQLYIVARKWVVRYSCFATLGVIMTKTDKQLAKLQNAKVLAWLDLVKALIALGYRKVEGDGSRVKFDNGNPSQMINLHKPHPDKEMKAYALRQIREKLKMWGLL